MTVLSRLQTPRDFIRWAVSRFHAEQLFFGHGTDNAWDDAQYLVLGALHLPWDIADRYLDCQLEDDEREVLHTLLRQRIEERIPTAYLLGEAWFNGLPFVVDSRVLIPRSPIGELIAAHFHPWLPAEPKRILDLCCGSGCIGIACAYEFTQAEVVLADLSFDALSVAGINIERHHMEDRVYTVQSDGFAGLVKQRFDLIVCNPPYVDAEDFADMPPEYQHEPAMALACGEDGLDLVCQLLAEAAAHLSPQGILVMEVGNSQGHLEALYPELDFTWLEFAHGGHGVFLLAASQLREAQSLLQQRRDARQLSSGTAGGE